MILVLGGTTEGRLAVKVLDESGKPYFYSTRGELQQVCCLHGQRVTGGMDTEKMEDFCRSQGIRLLIDAAHPFAVQLHETVEQVSRKLHLDVVRFERTYPARTDEVIWCKDYQEAVRRLKEDGISRLLALTGVQTIGKLRGFWADDTLRPECWFRILDREESVSLAVQQGFDASRLVFYHEDAPETELLEKLKPQAILTKESGESGGFVEKLEAARRLGIPVYAVCRPSLPASFITVTGIHGLRKVIERLLPDFYPLRSGYTTGACATAAGKAALIRLLTGESLSEVRFHIPDGEELSLPVKSVWQEEEASATAAVVKDAGDDPDVTHRSVIEAKVSFSAQPGIRFLQGRGVGKVTLPGLGLPVGEPAINPVPRQMIVRELSALYDGGLEVTISVPGGEELALRTFNPKLGIVGGISIIGTSGIVRPFSSEAFVEAIRREVEVCQAIGASRLVINSGAKSEKFVKREYPDLPPQAFVHYGNYIGDTLKIADDLHISKVTMGIMLGKAVKLAEGHLNTYSKQVVMNKQFLMELAYDCGCSPEAQKVIGNMTLARELWKGLPEPDAVLFFPALLNLCMKHCLSLLSRTELTLMLIDEEGHIVCRLTGQGGKQLVH
ncbi:cobalt-precorrin-5B (C(1))-methyltransferase CbiD [Phocaeicola sp.]|uniref:cobalt-precorrin-5B (C(1))-methyltransferase CbiD n=1 Tax=Phocaeicola sp. TaxID=2773926 RepID=UPI003A8DD800